MVLLTIAFIVLGLMPTGTLSIKVPQNRSKLLLQRQRPERNSMMQVDAGAGTNASAGAKAAAPSAADAPRWTGHYLTNTELVPIDTIACLQAKQQNPALNCSGLDAHFFVRSQGPLNIGNYPSWQDPMCNANGEYFCDPENLLTLEERQDITAQLRRLRDQTNVICRSRETDPIDTWHFRPFYLGVALAKEWPVSESDADSLQTFGRILAARWNMSYMWDGSPAPYSRCASDGMLIILPDRNQAYLSTPSCRFICRERGGMAVSLATLTKLDMGGTLASAVSAGIVAAYANLANRANVNEGLASEAAPATHNIMQDLLGLGHSWDAVVWNTVLRVAFVMAVLCVIASLAIAVLVCLLAPGLIKKLDQPVV